MAVNPMDHELAERLARIESHLAHLERQFEELNQVVIAQGRELARLKSAQQKIGDTIEASEGEHIRATDTKPPHYQ
jgi:uncharacterized coiled-coil protein SlyX